MSFIDGAIPARAAGVAVLDESVIEVAVKVAMLAEPMEAGALYVVVVVVDQVSEPNPVTADQVTPALAGSLLTVAVISCVVL